MWKHHSNSAMLKCNEPIMLNWSCEICMRSFSHMVWNNICDIGMKISFCVKLQGFEINFHPLMVRHTNLITNRFSSSCDINLIPDPIFFFSLLCSFSLSQNKPSLSSMEFMVKNFDSHKQIMSKTRRSLILAVTLSSLF